MLELASKIRAAALAAAVTLGGDVHSQQALAPASLDWKDGAGSSVARDGDWLAIGALDSDSVTAWKLIGGLWTEQAELAGSYGSEFGFAVGLSGDYLAVIERMNPLPLAIYERQGNAWTQVAAFEPWTQFVGTSDNLVLDFDDGVLAVGAPAAFAGGSAGGEVSVYEQVGTTWTEVSEFKGSQPGQRLGAGVSVDRDRILVLEGGVPGRVHTYERTGGAWNQAATLTAPAGSQFLGPVDLHGERMVLREASGLLRSYRLSGGGWVLEAEVPDPVAGPPDPEFGTRVDLFGDLMAVTRDGTLEEGSVYVYAFRAGVWELEYEVEVPGSDVGSPSSFGGVLDLYGEELLVGLPEFDFGASDLIHPKGMSMDPSTGTTYSVNKGTLYELVGPLDAVEIGPTGFGWVQSLAFDPGAGVLFGVDTQADELLRIDPATGFATVVGPVGSPLIKGLAYDVQQDVLWGSDAQTLNLVRIDPASGSGDAIGLISLLAVEGLAYDAAADVLYGIERKGGLLSIDRATGQGTTIGPAASDHQTLVYDPAAGHLLTSVRATATKELRTIDVQTGLTAFVGDLVLPESGVVLAYGLDLAQTYCTAGTSAGGCAARISEQDLVVDVQGVEGSKGGLFFYGSAGRQALPWGQTSSFQCVVPPVVRTSLQSGSGSPGACDGSFAFDLGALWAISPGPGAGHFVQAQFWYRDPLGAPPHSALSDGIEFLAGP